MGCSFWGGAAGGAPTGRSASSGATGRWAAGVGAAGCRGPGRARARPRRLPGSLAEPVDGRGGLGGCALARDVPAADDLAVLPERGGDAVAAVLGLDVGVRADDGRHGDS